MGVTAIYWQQLRRTSVPVLAVGASALVTRKLGHANHNAGAIEVGCGPRSRTMATPTRSWPLAVRRTVPGEDISSVPARAWIARRAITLKTPDSAVNERYDDITPIDLVRLASLVEKRLHDEKY